MNQLLQPGEMVSGQSSHEDYTVREFLGSGGEGEVYAVRGPEGGDHALKWFFAHTATREKAARLQALSEMPPPTPGFLWPQELAGSATHAGFGYVMGLRPPAYHGLAELLKAEIDPTFHALCTLGMELAHSFHLLHARGLCYQDLNDKNLFLEPATGQVLICDNDNIAVNGEPATVGGTLGFMAPEIVRGDARPSADTDRYALAVLLFKVLFRGHPLHGRREVGIRVLDVPARNRLYGAEPRFVFDPRDRSNAPVAGVHDTVLALWPVYPPALRALFVKAFTAGLTDPADGRVREREWRAELSGARDSLYRCASCGGENFLAPAGSSRRPRCWRCQADPGVPVRLRLDGLGEVALNADTRLYPHHLLSPVGSYDFSRPLAEVSRHPAQPSCWGLRNLGPVPWAARIGDGDGVPVPSGRSALLRDGLRLDFGGGVSGSILGGGA